MKAPLIQGKHTLKVKSDTRTGSNALPLCTFRQLYGDVEPGSILTNKGNANLAAHSGDKIKLLGTLEM